VSVSVVVAVRNARATIGACVDSLLALDPAAIEVLVVDNGSTDGTLDVLRGYAGRITVLHEQRRGAGAARNAGIAAARGEVVAFTDADCVVDTRWLGNLVGALADPDVGAVGGTILAADPANRVERYGEGIHDHHLAIEVYRPPYAITMNWASRRAVLQELGGFDERFLRSQDVDLSYRLVQSGRTLVFAPEAIVRHHNERTIVGLAREGFTHGFHGVQTRKRHDTFLRSLGHRRVDRGGYAALARRAADWARGRDRHTAQLDVAFNCGKKAGKLLGSLRFGHLDL
jgi:glycosyltransferase involved in cell wall biosynthesis